MGLDGIPPIFELDCTTVNIGYGGTISSMGTAMRKHRPSKVMAYLRASSMAV